MLRKIYGPTRGNGQWRIETKSERMAQCECQDTVTAVNVRRLEWLGHVIGMNERPQL
jgi:hypothetical protein